MSRLETIDTHDACGCAQKVALESAHDRIRTLESTLYDAEVFAIEAQAVLASCLSIADKPRHERATGILSRIVAKCQFARNHQPSTATKEK